MPSGTLEQLRVSYEDLGMSVEQIQADNPSYSIESVKAALMNSSPKFRADHKQELQTGEPPQIGFTEEQHRNVLQVIYDLATGAEDEHLRGKMATFIRDDCTGRRETAALIRKQGGGFNLQVFNISMQQARKRAKDMTERALGQVPARGKIIEA